MPDLLRPEIIRTDGTIIGKYIGGSIDIANRVFKGHGIRWHNNRPDLQGEHFSPRTYLMRSAGYPVVGVPTNYQHGLHKDFGNLAIGLVRFADEDEFGLFVEGELKTREQYIEMLKEIGRKVDMKFTDNQLANKSELMAKEVDTLIARVPMQFSGGFDPSTWIVNEQSKHIDQAGMIHLAFTPTPADDLNPIVRFKSAIDEVLKYEPTSSYSLPGQQTNSSTVFTGDTGHKGTDDASADNEAAQPKAHIDKHLSPLGDNTVITKANARDSIRQALDEVSRQELAAIVEEIAAEVGVEVAPADAEAIAEEAAGTIEQAVDEVASDETMMALDEEELEQKKSLLLKPVAQKHIFRAAYKYFGKRKADAEQARKQAQDAARQEYQKAQPANSQVGAYSNPANNPLGNHDVTTRNPIVNHITVDDRRFVGKTAKDMAMAVKLMYSQVPEYQRPYVTLGEVIRDEAFLTHLKGLIGESLEAKPFTGNDAIALKSAAPFIKHQKANELMATDIAAQGQEWVSIYYVTQAWREAEEDNQLFNLLSQRGMQVVTVPRGVNQVEFKLVDRGAEMYTRTEPNSLDSTGRPENTAPYTTPATSKINRNLKEHVVAVSYSHRLDLQSLLDVATEVNWDIQQALSEGLESTLLNGDTETAANTNINLIDGTPATGLLTPKYIAFNGLRKEPLVTVTAQSRSAGGSLLSSDYLNTHKLFPNKIQARTPNHLFVIDSQTKNKTRTLTDVKTKDVAGEENTLFTGRIPDLFDIVVYTSSQLALANSAGKISATPGNNTLGTIMDIYAPYCAYGRQQDVAIETDRDIDSGATKFVANIYHVFMTRGADSVMLTYNVGA